MKEKYVTPEVEIVEFDTEDIITTSTTNNSSTNSDPIQYPMIIL